MDIKTLNKDFNTQAKCLKHLELLRWGKIVKCPYCHSQKTKPIKSEKGRHNCRNCKRAFTVFVGTIFEDTRLPLTTWFQLIHLMLSAKNGISAKQIQRTVGMTYKTAYYAAMRVRIGMLLPDTILEGIIEMDESYFGGKKRKKNDPKNEANISSVSLKRGRGTSKISVAAMVARGGNIKTKVIEKLTKQNLMYMLKRYAKEKDSVLVTDGFKSYAAFDEFIEHMTVNHSKTFSSGIVHVNTVEGFWSFVKNGMKGNFRSISPKYLPFYLIEYEWKFNHRNFKGNEFDKYLKNALSHEKELEYWKAKTPKQVKQIAYE